MNTDIKAYLGNDPFIFVSYAHRDKDIVMPFIAALQRHFNVWFDEGIHYGAEWEMDIVDHLDKCDLFIYMITDNSLASQNCKDEIYRARELSKPFINVLCDSDITLPREFAFRYGRFQMCKLDTFSSYESAIEDMIRKSFLFDVVKRSASETEPAHGEYSESKCEDSKCTDSKCSMSPTEAFELGEEAYDDEDYETAVRYYTIAAEGGNGDAQFSLGYCYESGLGVAQDEKLAAYWYGKAAEQGNADGQLNLGYMYSKGHGVKQDYLEAIKWYEEAANQGNEDAKNNLKILRGY